MASSKKAGGKARKDSPGQMTLFDSPPKTAGKPLSKGFKKNPGGTVSGNDAFRSRSVIVSAVKPKKNGPKLMKGAPRKAFRKSQGLGSGG